MRVKDGDELVRRRRKQQNQRKSVPLPYQLAMLAVRPPQVQKQARRGKHVRFLRRLLLRQIVYLVSEPMAWHVPKHSYLRKDVLLKRVKVRKKLKAVKQRQKRQVWRVKQPAKVRVVRVWHSWAQPKLLLFPDQPLRKK